MDTRTKILEYAYDLFIKNGYNQTTIREIAAAAQVNLGLIPYYFGKKELLGGEVYAIMLKRIEQRVDYHLIPLENPLESYYYGYLMVQYFLLVNDNVNRYYTEFLVSADLSLRPRVQTQSIIQEIIEAYHVDVSPDYIRDYFSAHFGAERALIAKKRSGQLTMSYLEINATLVRIILNLLGIAPHDIENAIAAVDARVLDLPYDWTLLA